jgi:hypothetical protein
LNKRDHIIESLGFGVSINPALKPINQSRTFLERFESKFQKSKGCWEWLGALSPKGYGTIIHNGKEIKAHRASYALYSGDIPNGLWVLHTCDNRKCVNPDHLYLGTIKENVRDAVIRNRFSKGDDHVFRKPISEGGKRPVTKLNDSQVFEILTSTKQSKLLAEELRVSPSTICDIKKRRTWTHILI